MFNGPQVANASGPGGLPPWWILNGIKPAGPPKSMGSYSVVTFSKDQQAQFYIDETGKAQDKAKFKDALKEHKEEKKRKSSEKESPIIHV